MKKIFLGLFILFDLALIGGSSVVLYTRIQRSSMVPASMFNSKMTPATPSPATPNPASPAGSKPIIPLAPPGNTMSTSRKILFTYRNPHVKQVSIRADFTGWKAEPMQKAPNNSWTYQALLSPGEYAYCFTADDKTFKDPANKRTKQIGRTLVSAIVVEGLPSKPAK